MTEQDYASEPPEWQDYASEPPECSVARRVWAYVSLGAILLGGAYGIFVLPYSFPLTEPVIDSPSYLLGYNNQVAVLAVLAVIGLVSLWHLFLCPGAPQPVDALFRPALRRGEERLPGMPRSILFLFLAIDVTITSLLYYCVPYLEEYFEAAAFLHRLQLSIRYDLAPYHDFSWGHGLGFFHITRLFMQGFSLLGFAPEVGYMTSLMLLSAAGMWVLFIIVDDLRIKVSHRILIYGIVVIVYQELTLGLNGVMLRFVAPYGAILLIHAVSSRLAERREPAAIWKLCGASWLCGFSVMALALELGLGYLVAQAAYFAHRTYFAGRTWLFPLAATVTCVPIWLLAFPDSLQAIQSISKGAWHIPLFPAPYMLLFLGSLFWVIPKLLRACATLRPSAEVPLILAWAILLGVAIGPSLGRCEHTHITTNGIVVFVTALAALSRFRPRLFPFAAILFALIYGVVMRAAQVAGIGELLQPVRQTLGGKRPVPSTEPSALIATLGLSELSGVAAPLGLDGNTKRYLISRGRYAPLYHPDFSLIGTQKDVETKIQGLAKATYLVVPEWILQLRDATDQQILASREANRAQYDAQQGMSLGLTLLYPIDFKSRHLPLDAMLTEARHIANHYKPLRRAGGWVLMERDPTR